MASNTETLGINNLKRVIAFLLMISFELADLIKNFTLSKAVALGFRIAENQDLLSVGKIALAELKDLSVDESAEITAFIGVNFDLADDTLEQRIESGLELIPEGYALIKRNLAFFNKASSFVKSWGSVDVSQVKQLETRLESVSKDQKNWFTKLAA